MAGTRVEAVLFDLGGTLVDERDFAGWASFARHAQLDLEPDRVREAFVEVERELDLAPIGPRGEGTVVEFWRRVLSRAAEREVEPLAVRRFLEARSRQQERPLSLYSDVRRCLDTLRALRLRLGVISNSQGEASVRRILDRVGIVGYFERVVSSGSEGVAKPEPEIFRRALERLKLPADRALYVGNLEHTDALAARRAGLWSVWLNRDGTGLADGTPEITSLLEVPLVVREIARGSERYGGPAS